MAARAISAVPDGRESLAQTPPVSVRIVSKPDGLKTLDTLKWLLDQAEAKKNAL